MTGSEGQAVVPFPDFSPVLNSDELEEEVVGREAEGQLGQEAEGQRWPVGLSPEAGHQDQEGSCLLCACLCSTSWCQ